MTNNQEPIMTIQYLMPDRTSISGNFDNIPETAFGARISYFFPLVGPNGNFQYTLNTYDLVVGEEYNISDLLDKINPTLKDEDEINKFQKYKEAGIRRVVLSKLGYRPLKGLDTVFKTRDEMLEAINKINQTFKTMTVSFESTPGHTIK